MPEDQKGTISGKWPALAVPIAFQAGHFSVAEKQLMVAAMDTWNAFHEKSRNRKLVDYGSDAANPTERDLPQALDICTQSIVNSNNQFTGFVMVYKKTSWPRDQKDVIALTKFCPINETPFPRIVMGSMELNYEDFFLPGNGRKIPDLQSIFLHELGHLIGLNHSCEGFNKTGTPNCGAPETSKDYLEAVMFPGVLFPDNLNGEQRRELKKNDMGRGNCLYESG